MRVFIYLFLIIKLEYLYSGFVVCFSKDRKKTSLGWVGCD